MRPAKRYAWSVDGRWETHSIASHRAAVLAHNVPCHVMPCCVCYAMLRYAVLCYAVLCCAMLCYAWKTHRAAATAPVTDAAHVTPCRIGASSCGTRHGSGGGHGAVEVLAVGVGGGGAGRQRREEGLVGREALRRTPRPPEEGAQEDARSASASRESCASDARPARVDDHRCSSYLDEDSSYLPRARRPYATYGWQERAGSAFAARTRRAASPRRAAATGAVIAWHGIAWHSIS